VAAGTNETLFPFPSEAINLFGRPPTCIKEREWASKGLSASEGCHHAVIKRFNHSSAGHQRELKESKACSR